MPPRVTICAAVEGIVDESVAQKLILDVGADPGPVYGKTGKAALHARISGYNDAARHAPWLVIVDLDRDADCAPRLRQAWVPDRAPFLCFRIAVRQLEAWLLADAEAIASFLGLVRKQVSPAPKELDDGKQAMVNLARRSRRGAIRADMVPREASGRSEGPAYASRLIEFVDNHWRPEVAARVAGSLERTLVCLRRLATGAQDDVPRDTGPD